MNEEYRSRFVAREVKSQGRLSLRLQAPCARQAWRRPLQSVPQQTVEAACSIAARARTVE